MKRIYDIKTGQDEVVELTAEEETIRQADIANAEAEKTAEENAKTEKENLKASAKSKLIAGEPMTEEEANVLVGV
jgi:hypothetical protein|tara:strand:+ start:631 stop:855 length:225 start_codon:yes stop_codon:yes gene_type:complete